MHVEPHTDLGGDELMCHFHIVLYNSFVRGVHTKNQYMESLTWTYPWDENENGEEGKDSFKESGLSFENCTSYVEALNSALYDFIDVFNFSPMLEQLQFNETHYWIAKP